MFAEVVDLLVESGLVGAVRLEQSLDLLGLHAPQVEARDRAFAVGVGDEAVLLEAREFDLGVEHEDGLALDHVQLQQPVDFEVDVVLRRLGVVLEVLQVLDEQVDVVRRDVLWLDVAGIAVELVFRGVLEQDLFVVESTHKPLTQFR